MGRSKEVDKSIKSLENFVNQKYYNGVTAEEMKTVLKYISELEAKLEFKQFGDLDSLQFENTYLDKQVIRDKIKVLEEDKDSKYYYMFLNERDIEKTISILKELLEGE